MEGYVRKEIVVWVNDLGGTTKGFLHRSTELQGVNSVLPSCRSDGYECSSLVVWSDGYE